ncbi:MAG: NADH:ubiquinone reductase (Na(+)-transporting) subunit A, partial [Paramuribaculum sp.]|nr:NADH:ubiquinone reductase (Na(+)-transporting) subunit A [Paramuribaculum sp.]
MDKSLTVERGLDLSIKGAAEWSSPTAVKPTVIAVIPDDFPGFLPKLEVK